MNDTTAATGRPGRPPASSERDPSQSYVARLAAKCPCEVAETQQGLAGAHPPAVILEVMRQTYGELG